MVDRLDRIFSNRDRNWLFIHVAAVFALVFFFLFRPVNFYLLDKVYSSYYMILVPVLVGMYYLSRGLKDGIEIKVLTAYCVWIFISRVINGVLFLELDRDLVFESFLICILVGMASGLDSSFRLKVLDVLSAGITLLFTFICTIGVYAGAFQKSIVNPITGATLVSFSKGMNRLTMFDINPCNGTVWVYVSFCLLIYLFLRYKKWCYRVPVLVSLLIHYFYITLAFTRSVRLSACVMFGMLVAMLVIEHKKEMTVKKKVLLLVVVACITGPLFYKSFDLSAKIFEILNLSEIQLSQSEYAGEELSNNISVKTQGETTQNSTVAYERDAGFDDNGRFEIWVTAIKTMFEEPHRLVKGSLTKDIVEITARRPGYQKEEIKTIFGHFHNSYLQILVVGGLLGIVLAMSFFLLLIWKSIKLFFAPKGSVEIAEKYLGLAVTSIMIYNLFESSLFCGMDFRSVSFFVISGFVIAAAKDIPKVNN